MSFFGGGRTDSTSYPDHDHSHSGQGGDTIAPQFLTVEDTAVIKRALDMFGAGIPAGALAALAIAEVLQLNMGALDIDSQNNSRTTSVNDFNPTGTAGIQWGLYRMTGNGTFNVTGLDATWAAATVSGQPIVIITATGTGTKTFVDASALSVAANRFAMGGDQSIGQGQSIAFWYDSAASRWRVLWTSSISSGAADHTHSAAGDGGATIAPTVVSFAGRQASTARFDIGTVSVSQDNVAIGSVGLVQMAPSGAARNLTGMVKAADWQRVVIINTGTAFAINLRHDLTSTAANRFYTPGAVDPYLVPPFACVEVIYDPGVARWRVLNN